MADNTDLERMTYALESADRSELVEQWRCHYRNEPPKGVSRRFLIAGIAHHHQLKLHGHSASRLHRRIERTAGKRGERSRALRASLAPGARLIREWNGSTYTVDVTDNGYVCNGVEYRSLSAIARSITGARWSGPRFFGLTQDPAS